MLYFDAFDAYIAKPSQCLAVITMYFMPAAWAMAAHSSARNLTGLNRGAKVSVAGHGNLRVVHDPFAGAVDAFALVRARRQGVDPPVDEHAESRFAPPAHPGVALLLALRGRRLGGPKRRTWSDQRRARQNPWRSKNIEWKVSCWSAPDFSRLCGPRFSDASPRPTRFGRTPGTRVPGDRCRRAADPPRSRPASNA